jgi:hypothetical protein
VSETPLERLSRDEQLRLAVLADVLIPGGYGLPSASEAHLADGWITRVLSVRQDLTAAVRVVSQTTGEPAASLRRIRSESVELFEGFTFAVAGAYLMNPRVRKLLGYPGQAPRRKVAYPDESDHYLQGGLLEPVRARGPIYRPTPARSNAMRSPRT